MLSEQLAEFARMADYLQAKNVKIAVVFLPVGSWDLKHPYTSDYMKGMMEICQARHIPTIDWSRILPDDDFGDGVHVNVTGMEKLRPRFLQIALPFLRTQPSQVTQIYSKAYVK
jgi:hypothetical protein